MYGQGSNHEPRLKDRRGSHQSGGFSCTYLLERITSYLDSHAVIIATTFFFDASYTYLLRAIVYTETHTCCRNSVACDWDVAGIDYPHNTARWLGVVPVASVTLPDE